MFFSKRFNVSNRVRLGGILSPTLFNLYMDQQSVNLTKLWVGCVFDNVCINHILYADDTVLLVPSPAALQKLINACVHYGLSNDIRYNTINLCV